jgi:hypothetical protein
MRAGQRIPTPRKTGAGLEDLVRAAAAPIRGRRACQLHALGGVEPVVEPLGALVVGCGAPLKTGAAA